MAKNQENVPLKPNIEGVAIPVDGTNLATPIEMNVGSSQVPTHEQTATTPEAGTGEAHEISTPTETVAIPVMTPQPGDQNQRVYLDQRKILLDAEQSQAASFDKAILTLSGGAIALSMTFVKDLIGERVPTCPSLLAVAWITLGGAVVGNLVSIYLSQRAHEVFKDLLDEAYAEYGDEFQVPLRKEQEKCWRTKWIGRLNLASIVCFSVGMSFLGLFGALNTTGNESTKGNGIESKRQCACKDMDQPRQAADGPGGAGSKSASPSVPGTNTISDTAGPVVTTQRSKAMNNKINTTQPIDLTEGAKPPLVPVVPTTRPTDSAPGAGGKPPMAPVPLPKPPIDKSK